MHGILLASLMLITRQVKYNVIFQNLHVMDLLLVIKKKIMTTKFNINKDKFQFVVNLGDYDGYTIDASCLNKEKNLYHAILVCYLSDMAKEQNNKLSHRVQNNFMKRKNRQVTYHNNQNNHNNNNQTISDQCLVTIDLNENKIINSVPVKRFMGPFIYDSKFA